MLGWQSHTMPAKGHWGGLQEFDLFLMGEISLRYDIFQLSVKYKIDLVDEEAQVESRSQILLIIPVFVLRSIKHLFWEA